MNATHNCDSLGTIKTPNRWHAPRGTYCPHPPSDLQEVFIAALAIAAGVPLVYFGWKFMLVGLAVAAICGFLYAIRKAIPALLKGIFFGLVALALIATGHFWAALCGLGFYWLVKDLVHPRIIVVQTPATKE